MQKIRLISALLGLILLLVFGGYYFWSKEKTIVTDLLLVEMDVNDLAKESVGVITAKVVNILPSQQTIGSNGENPSIYTDYILLVKESIKGKFAKQITLRIPGGTIHKGRWNQLTAEVEDAPKFASGEEVLIFLSDNDGGFFTLPKDHYTIEGWIQGKYSIKNNQAINQTQTINLQSLIKQINSSL